MTRQVMLDFEPKGHIFVYFPCLKLDKLDSLFVIHIHIATGKGKRKQQYLLKTGKEETQFVNKPIS